MNTNTIAIMNSKQQTNGNKLSSGYHSMTEFTSFNQVNFAHFFVFQEKFTFSL